MIENPKASGTDIAQQVYNVSNRQTAQVIASENLSKPIIQTELAKYTKQIEDTLYRAVVDWGDSDTPRKREIALDSAKFIHDKVHGKATQRVETRSEAVTISIDLTKPSTDTDSQE